MFGVARIRLGQNNRLGPKARDVFFLTFFCFGVEVGPALNRVRGQSSPWFPQVVREDRVCKFRLSVVTKVCLFRPPTKLLRRSYSKDIPEP